MEEKLSTIIEQSTQLFMKYGIRSLTMDDVAKNLRMSKKTLYQFVSDKDDLVTRCIDAGCLFDSNCIQHILDENHNAIDELLAISRFVSDRINNIHPSIFFDLEKYHPEAMGRFEKHKNEFIFNCVKRNLTSGIEHGLYRENLNTSIVSRIYLSCVDNVLHGEVGKQSDYSLIEVYTELVKYHLHGIVSDKGLTYLANLNHQEQK